MNGIRKQNLPIKVCRVCEKPFAWRKKWENVWNDVTHCSSRCRSAKGTRRKLAHPMVEDKTVSTLARNKDAAGENVRV
jgi:hypothetical protein